MEMNRHPVECGQRLMNSPLAPFVHLGDHVCTHPAPTAAENELPGYLAHACGIRGCSVTWSCPTQGLARMGREEALERGFAVLPESSGVSSMAEAKVAESAPRCMSPMTILGLAVACSRTSGHPDGHGANVRGSWRTWYADGTAGHNPCAARMPDDGIEREVQPVCVGVAGHEGPHAAPYLGTDPLGTEYTWTDREAVSGPCGEVIPKNPAEAVSELGETWRGVMDEAARQGVIGTPPAPPSGAEAGALDTIAEAVTETARTHLGMSHDLEFRFIPPENGADTPTHPTSSPA